MRVCLQEDGSTGDADGSREPEAGAGTVDEVPEEGVDEGKRERDLQRGLPGEFTLYASVLFGHRQGGGGGVKGRNELTIP